MVLAGRENLIPAAIADAEAMRTGQASNPLLLPRTRNPSSSHCLYKFPRLLRVDYKKNEVTCERLVRLQTQLGHCTRLLHVEKPGVNICGGKLLLAGTPVRI